MFPVPTPPVRSLSLRGRPRRVPGARPPARPRIAALAGTLAALALVASAPGPASAQQTATAPDSPSRDSASGGSVAAGEDRRLEAVRAPSPHPDVDGRLDDAAWSASEVATDFVQFDPEPGAEPSQRTEVRLLYSPDAVYVGARMYDASPGEIVDRLSRRDESVVADRFLVGFDSYRDRRTAFVFGVTAAGVQSDALLHDDTRVDENWDAVWESAVRVDSAGWVAEIRVPLSQLRFSAPAEAAGGDTWGVNFQREIARLEETDQWAPFPADRSRMVSAFGTLTGLEELSSPSHLEVRPYAVVRADRAPVAEENPFRGSTEPAGSVGGSLSYGITPNLTLNATVNPDFGQVEADPSVVNLSAFESFFPEKRPFFQEGSDIFQFDIGIGDGGSEQLFYSRRIGRTPRGSVPSDARFSRSPDATTILGAAKLSGKTSGGWSVGVLNAVTAEETARYLRPGEGIRGATAEPTTDYGVARVKKDFREGESSAGAILTTTIRDVEPGGPVGHLPSSALAGGLDARHRFAGGDWRLAAKLLASRVAGNAGAIDRLQRSPNHYYQRPDAGHLTHDPTRTSLSGVSADVELIKVSGHWRGGFLGQTRSPGFDVNELGFQRGADRSITGGFLGYRSLGPEGPFRSWSANASGFGAWTYGGEHLQTGGNVNGSFQLRNHWRGHAGVNVSVASVSTTELRGGPALREQPRLNGRAGVSTDSRKAVRLGLSASWAAYLNAGGGRLGLGPRITVRPTDAAQVSLSPRMSWNSDPAQYVATAEGSDGLGPHYVLGRLEQRTASLTTRVDYAFSPDLSVQLYAQPFLSAGDYTRFREVRDPGAADFEARFRTYAAGEVTEEDGGHSVDRDGDGQAELSFGDPDFNVRQLRSNLVVRWEYMPGSRVFLVWSQDRSGFARDGRFDLGRDLGGLFGADARNVFLVKVEHWVGL